MVTSFSTLNLFIDSGAVQEASLLQDSLKEFNEKYPDRPIQALGDHSLIINNTYHSQELLEVADLIKGRSISSMFFTHAFLGFSTDQGVKPLLKDVVTCSVIAEKEEAIQVLRALSANQTVTDLSLIKPDFTHPQLERAVESLSETTNTLHALRVVACHAFKNRGPLLTRMIAAHQLRLFALTYTPNLTINEMEGLCDALKRQHMMTKLDFSHTPLDVNLLDLLGNALKANKVLERLTISPKVTGDSYSFLTMLYDNKRTALSSLQILNKHDLSASEIRILLGLLDRDILRYLRVQRFGTTKDRLMALRRELRKNKRLFILKLSDYVENPLLLPIFEANTTIESWVGKGKHLYVKETSKNKQKNNHHLWRWIQSSVLIAWMRGNPTHPLRNSVQPLLQVIALMAAVTDREQLGKNYKEEHTMETHFKEADNLLKSMDKFLNTKFYHREVHSPQKKTSTMCCIQ